MSKDKIAGLLIGASMVCAVLSTMFTMNQIKINGFFYFSFSIILYFTVQIIVQAFAVCQIFKGVNKSFVFLLAAWIFALSNLCSFLTESLEVYANGIKAAESYLDKFWLRIPFLIVEFSLIYFVIWLVRKSKFRNILYEMMHRSRPSFFAGAIMIILNFFGLHIFSSEFVVFGNSYNYSVYIVLFICVLVMVILLLRSYMSELKENKMKVVVAQQAEYLKNLEEIQRKLRVMNHDYKNVMAGLYLSAEAGDVDTVKNYINDQLLMLDHEIRMDIAQVNQLIHVEHIELKSLLIAKIAYAGKKETILNFEINHSIGHINMPVSDMLRSFGILLDNAIEGASETKEKVVNVLIMEENHITTFMVKNQLKEKIPLSQIFRPEYSTKGKGRGLGLYSLKETLKKYPHIFLETHVESGCLIQIIKMT